MTSQRFPLSWPTGWKRTAPASRTPARFHGTVTRNVGTSSWRQKEPLSLSLALARLEGEMRRLGVIDGDWLISSDLRVRLDGLPYFTQAQPADPGVAVYFRLDGKDRVLACDAWTRIADNIAAIAAHIECIRGIDRYSVGTMDQAFAGYAALPPKGSTWRTTLGFGPDDKLTIAQIAEAFKALARTAHPDVSGGSHDAMTSLVKARDEGIAELMRLFA